MVTLSAMNDEGQSRDMLIHMSTKYIAQLYCRKYVLHSFDGEDRLTMRRFSRRVQLEILVGPSTGLDPFACQKGRNTVGQSKGIRPKISNGLSHRIEQPYGASELHP